MSNNTNNAADLAVMQAEVSALRFHAERLRDAKLNTGSANVAEHVLRSIDGLPALYAASVEGAL
jgi:hypothetical protein